MHAGRPSASWASQADLTRRGLNRRVGGRRGVALRPPPTRHCLIAVSGSFGGEMRSWSMVTPKQVTRAHHYVCGYYCRRPATNRVGPSGKPRKPLPFAPVRSSSGESRLNTGSNSHDNKDNHTECRIGIRSCDRRQRWDHTHSSRQCRQLGRQGCAGLRLGMDPRPVWSLPSDGQERGALRHFHIAVESAAQ